MYQNPINFFFGFYEVFPGPHFFHKDPGWNPKGQPKGPKRKMLDRQKNPSKFLSYFMRSLQDTTFSTRIQDGILRDSQRDKKGTCLTSGKTLASVYLISWGRLRTLLFPPGSRMGSQGATKGTKQENAWRVETTLASFYYISWDPFRTSLFPPGSKMGSQGTTKGTKKENAWQVAKPYRFLFGILWGPSRTSLFPPGSRVGSKGTTKRAKKENAWRTEKP